MGVIKTKPKREPITKKMRFEVFKRDKFTCQYCGRMSPDVVLEVDHIKPVVEGGTNDMLNLITSCRDCNRGKGKRELSDDTAVKKQQAMLNELADKNEQLEMMVKWKDELLKLDDKKVDIICGYIFDTYDGTVCDSGKKKIKVLLKRYSVDEIMNAIDDAYARTMGDCTKILDLVPKCAYYAKHPIDENVRKILYLRKILINRLSYVNNNMAFRLIEQALYVYNIPFDNIKSLCCNCKNWTEFRTTMERLGQDGREENVHQEDY